MKRQTAFDEMNALRLKIDRLFDRLDGRGKIKVYRVVGGAETYATTIHNDPGLSIGIEDRIARVCGGGSFALKAFHGRTPVASVTLAIDEGMYPPRLTEAEQRRQTGRR